METNCSFTPRNAQLLSNSTDFVPQPDFGTAVLATGQRSWNLRLVPDNGYVLDATSVSRVDSLKLDAALTDALAACHVGRAGPRTSDRLSQNGRGALANL